jgi:hypothetical protein
MQLGEMANGNWPCKQKYVYIFQKEHRLSMPLLKFVTNLLQHIMCGSVYITVTEVPISF